MVVQAHQYPGENDSCIISTPPIKIYPSKFRMNHSQKLIEKIVIRAKQENVFDFAQDYHNRLKWDTFLKKAELVGGALKAGKGVRAYCVSKNSGLGMETEYVTFQRPKVTAIKMTQGPILFKSFAGSWTFNQIGPEETEVVFIYS
ncbi:MAG: SRPBCC family protein [Chitinophagaceae bacterium]